MQKVSQIKQCLLATVPSLNKNPDRLILTVTDGKPVATGAASLSFEWNYKLQIGVIDFAGHPDDIMVPLLAWLRQNQSDLFHNRELRENGIRFEMEMLANDLYDLLITVSLTERVIVTKTEDGIGWEHVPEPPEDPYDGIVWELFINGEKVA
ncbi:MAG: phage tail protein [Plesiomonas shigelloides]|uniref:phage tail protein n=1 Tax=Plesiomonas shigelloides TaxID=703 RepID=UPI00057ACDE1|nr:phage tail protein [Plesiomonas shigelloides]